MITKEEFTKINDEIKQSVENTLAYIKHNYFEDYILFLANGEYRQEYENSHLNLNPYTIDDRTDLYKDENRLNFFDNIFNIKLYFFL